jgi:hypothetical protein
MSRHQEDSRYTQDGGSDRQDRLKKTISSAVRRADTLLRLCFIVSVTAATLTIEAVLLRISSAVRRADTLLRLCFIVIVIAATLTQAAVVVVLLRPLFMR